MVDREANPADFPEGEEIRGRRALPSEELGGATQVVFSDPIITGGDLSGADQIYDERNRPAISFTLRPAGAQRFGDTTTQNRGELFAIVLDDVIISAPRINEPITGGAGRITGNFTPQEAENLAIVLRSGALPAKLRVVEQRLVGAGLGEDSIRSGVTASLVGLGLVACFMMFYYGLLGIFAVTALAVNITLLIGILSALGATLTLPGIGGILLTVGMAVDANVLVFERIREEKRNGRSPMSSVETGQAGDVDHSGRQHHDAAGHDYPVCDRLRAGARLCRDAVVRRYHVDLHGGGADALVRLDVAEGRASEVDSAEIVRLARLGSVIPGEGA